MAINWDEIEQKGKELENSLKKFDTRGKYAKEPVRKQFTPGGTMSKTAGAGRNGGERAGDSSPLKEFFTLPSTPEQALREAGYGAERFAAAMLGAGENITDFIGSTLYKGMEGVTSLGGLAPNPVSKWAGESADRFLDNSITRDYEESIRRRYQPSEMAEKATGFGQTVAQMIIPIGASKVVSGVAKAKNALDVAGALQKGTNIGRALFGLQAAGGSANEARQDGASTERAVAYGAASGLLESSIESIAGAVPGLGEGKISEIAQAVTKSPVVRKTLDILGEGGEEALSTVLTPFLKRAIYDPEADHATGEEIAQSAILGAMAAGVLQAGIELPTAASDTVSNIQSVRRSIGTNEDIAERATGRLSRPKTDPIKEQHRLDMMYGQQGLTLPTAEQAERQMRYQRAETDLERSGIQAGVADETIQQAQRIASAVRRDVRFYDGGGAAGPQSTANGFYDPRTDTIYVNSRSRNTVAQIVSHELTHSVELADAYKDLSGIVMQRIRETGGDLEQMRQEKRDLYTSNGVELDGMDTVDREIVAEYVERYLLTDEQSILDLTARNRSLGQRIKEWLDGLLAKLGSTSAQERTFLTKARDTYARALEQTQTRPAGETGQETARQAKPSAAQSQDTVRSQEARKAIQGLRDAYASGSITEEEFDSALDAVMEQESLDGESMLDRRYSFGGENAKGADLEALRRAKEMDEQGVADDVIFRETGWYTGADGKWRFEMDDSKMEYHIRNGAGDVPGETLADYLTHDELFKNYPQLRKTKLEFTPMERGIQGRYNGKTDTITLSEELRGAPEETLIHEIQHAIQKAEGFAKGANTTFWDRQLESGYDGRTQQQRREAQRLWQEYDRIRDSEPDFFAAMMGLEAIAPDVPRGAVNWDTLEQIEEDPPEWKRYDAAREALEQQYGDLKVWDFNDLRYKLKQVEMNAGRTPADLYYDTAGEIEARDTARRRTLTADERRAKMPDTGNEDTVFVEEVTDDWSGTGEQVAGWALEDQKSTEDEKAATQEEVAKDDGPGYTGRDRGTQDALTSPEQAALLAYKSGDSYKLNALLRDGRTLTAGQQRMTEEMDRALEKMPVHQGRVYRRLSFDLEGPEALDTFLEEHEPGGFVQYPAFTSSSTEPDGYLVDGDLTVTQIIESQNGRNLEGVGNNFESEIVFPRLSAFSVERVERDEQGRHVIYMREVMEHGTRQLYPEEQYGRMQQVQEVPQGDRKLREVPGMDPKAEAGGQMPGLRADGADEGKELRLPGGEEIEYSFSETEAEKQDDKHTRSWTRDALPVKAQQYLQRAERALTNKIANKLSVPRQVKRNYLDPIVRDISDEYLREGKVSREAMDDLFERAYEEGIVADREYYDDYKDLRDYLRHTKLTISQEDSRNIPGFNDFRKANFGRLDISIKGGTNIDQVYQELQERWPELFSEQRESHPADQLVHIVEVARSFQIVQRSLDEYYGEDAADARRWARHDFEVAVDEAMNELRTVRRYADARAEKAESKPEELTTQEEVTEAWGKLKDARRSYEKAAARNLLTDHDEVQVGKLLRGEIEPQDIDPKTDNVRGIMQVYQAKQGYDRLAKTIKQWNMRRKAALKEEADRYLETANDWKDKRAGILYSRETMERNIRDIVKDEKLAEDIIRAYFKPVHDGAAAANRMKNRYRDRVRALDLSRKVLDGNAVSEAHAVQLLGEAEDNIRVLEQSKGRLKERDGKSLEDWRGIVADLWAENPNLDQGKIRAAVAEFRAIYDELFQKMNETRVRNGYEPVNYRRGYFPHFQPGDGDGIIGQFGKALGISTEVTALPTTINGLTHTFRPGIRWFGNAQERLGFNTAYDAVEGFDRYIEGVADVIHQTDNIQKLRALASQARYRTGDEGLRKQVDRVREDPSIQEEDKESRIREIYQDGKFALSNFVVELDEYTNLLANKKSRADRNMEQALGRNMYNLVKALESRVAANMVAVNPGSWLTNFIPLTQGGALLDRGMLMRGMWDTLKAYKADDGIVGRSSFLTNRRGSDPLVKTWAERASATASKPMEYIDQFVADSLVRARYQQNLTRGMSEDSAMGEADAWVAGVMADRSKGSTPTLFQRSNPLTKIFTQFQLEVNNQLSYLFKDMPKDVKDRGGKALAAALIKFFLGAWLYNEVYEYFIGRRPALDPIGILNDSVGDLTGWELPNLVELGTGAVTGDMPSLQTEKKGAYDAAANLTGQTVEQLPFIGGVLGGGRVPISSALPDWENLGKAVLSDKWSGKKKAATAAKELASPLTYLALPFGGGQLKKVYQGLRAVAEGGSYSVDTEGNDVMQYPVFNDTMSQKVGNAARGVLFGKTSLPTAQDWVESGFKSFGAKETAVYQGMTDTGVPDEDAYDLLLSLRGAEKTETESEAAQERRILDEADISGAGKSVVYYGLLASEDEQALMDELEAMGADMGEVTAALMGIKDAGALRGAEASNAKRDAIAGTGLSDQEKIAIYRDRISDSRDEEIQAFKEAGMDFDQFLEAQNEYSTIDEEYEEDGPGQKAVEFARWVNSQMLTADKAEVMKDSFVYYSQIPQNGGYYEKFTAAGMDDQAAYDLNAALSGLEPLEGEDKVSSLQRYRAVTESGLSDQEQLMAMEAIMSESEFAKLRAAGAQGVTPKAYVSYKQELPFHDADKNKSYSQEEVKAALDRLPLTRSQKAALWQMQNKSWKPNRNPYSVSVGQAVYGQLNQEKEDDGLKDWNANKINLPTAGELMDWN